MCPERPCEGTVAQRAHSRAGRCAGVASHSSPSAPFWSSALAEPLRADLSDECAWCHARDRTELSDQMRLVIVAGCGGDARPARMTVLPRGAQCALEARELGERL